MRELGAADSLCFAAQQAILAIPAHEPGPPVVIKGVHQFGGVRGLTLRKDRRTLLSVRARARGTPHRLGSLHLIGLCETLLSQSSLTLEPRTALCPILPQGGADGFVRVWNVEKGTLDESCLVKMYCMGFAKETPPVRCLLRLTIACSTSQLRPLWPPGQGH